MAAKAALLCKTHALLRCKTLTLTLTPHLRSISSSPSLSQDAQPLQDPQLQDPPPSPLPPHPSPYYQSTWRTPASAGAAPLMPLYAAGPAAFSPAQSLDAAGLMNQFASWMAEQRWTELKQMFEFWIRTLDAAGKPNKPDVSLYNQYLMANFATGSTAGELLDLVAQMQDYGIAPNTASYNIVLKAMYTAREREAAEKLLDRMLLTSTMPDDESYNLVIGLSILTNGIDSALKYLDLSLKSGYMVSLSVFTDFVHSCVNAGRLDTLASIIEKCKTTDQNKALSPPWKLCNSIADIALQADHSKLAFFALEFLARWIARGEIARPPVYLSADEGLVVSALSTAARTNNPTLLDAAWSILRRSLRQKKAPNPETLLAKIHAYASLGNLKNAFSTLIELETVYGSSEDVDEELFSPFTSLHSLVVACCKNGFSTLDTVYLQLENLSRADPPYKSVAALNCVILGCANIWDLDRAYETFEAISEKIGLTPDVHSYNALLCAFGKLRKADEASKVFEHLISIGVKPNATTYELLVDAHLVNRDPKAALAIIDKMVDAGFTPSKETLKKVRRRCSRELDFDSDDKLKSLAQQFKYRMGAEGRREMLYNLQYSTEY